MNEFLKEINTGLTPDETDNVFAGIWKEYERVLLHSIITTFGLDFIIKDAIGGTMFEECEHCSIAAFSPLKAASISSNGISSTVTGLLLPLIISVRWSS